MKLHDAISRGFNLRFFRGLGKETQKMGLSNRKKGFRMLAFTNGVAANLIPGQWMKSRLSEANGMCVEVAALPHGYIAIRNSTDPDGPALVVRNGEMAAFIDGAKKGEFDSLCTN
ncbi:DUF397 domain-containing protein [Streptomyces sp. NPDC002533]